ncbi:cytokinin dehydrogenase 5 [Lotus japonicus]|uniref:cytokinin dehydrogenase 5 n=1 Tax=Lotus japonicus TaxID=34305 RepID=UPI00258D4706|nr:cytokinin dehydrogenase 5 [Lotus japonicus]
MAVDTFLLLALAMCRLIVTVGLTVVPTELLHVELAGQLSVDTSEVEAASVDFGMLSKGEPPLAVVHPVSAEDVAQVVKAAYDGGFTVSARGHGHSINGQALMKERSRGRRGVVIEMVKGHGGDGGGPPPPLVSEKGKYVDVWGGELWIEVLRATLEHGLAPMSWTDYLYLSVGGTLSNAGISGQTFNYGPQISNVLELDVVTGKGEVLTCSEDGNSELFHGVLGGLGQFGIITRARIALQPAPHRVRWIRVLYSNFSTFCKDQEFLISLQGKHASQRFDYVEGFVIVDEGLINNWRSSFFSPSNPVKITSLNAHGDVLYCLEITKDYHQGNADSIDEEIEALLKKLDFIQTSVFTTDVPYVDFLDRVHKAELKLRSKGLWDVPHPWLNLFVPKSRIKDFDKGVFKGILGNSTSGPILIYPMNKHKWDHRSSAVTPEEEMFYLVAFLRSALDTEALEYLTKQNRQILRFCQDSEIKVKQYMPHYTTQQEWMDHFGDKWTHFQALKMQFDPRRILATGQQIFQFDEPYTDDMICSKTANSDLEGQQWKHIK